MQKKFVSLVIMLLVFIMLPVCAWAADAREVVDVTMPRYVSTTYYGDYVIRTNKLYQIKADGSEKLVSNLGRV